MDVSIYIERKIKFTELLGLEPVHLVSKSNLRWFEHVECKGDVDWVERYM